MPSPNPHAVEEHVLHVHVELEGRTRYAGRLVTHSHPEWERAVFVADARWAASRDAARMAPALTAPRTGRARGGTAPLFGAIGDSAPDRWGRTLLRRGERRRAREEGRPPRPLAEHDFLAGVRDELRAGNLRFSESRRGEFVGRAAARPLPTIAALPRLAAAVAAYERDSHTDGQLELLVETGQLLGGSRPKASLRARDGRLLLAKFPSVEDGRDMQAWEWVTLRLAADCGIAVPPARLARIGRQNVLLLERFDRDRAGRRSAFVSAMGLLQTSDNESLSVLRFAERVASLSAAPREDLLQLWTRTLFSVLVSNKDNHLRNHGMRLVPEGWRLAPAYDINPEPQKLRPRQLILSIDGVDDRASCEVALGVAEAFGIAPRLARGIARTMAARLAEWKSHARACGLPRGEIARMAGAFEHADLERAARA